MPDARLLLVLDDSLAKELQDTLKGLGYQIVDCVSTGQQALESSTKLRPDLALVGIHLSGELEGIVIGKQLYDQYDLPVIYISNQCRNLIMDH